MCIFVPAGHLNAGTAADTSREVGSMGELIFYEVKKKDSKGEITWKSDCRQ
jgi:hypothetical protein